MENHKFILLIMNCKRYNYKAFFQKQTWLKRLPDITYFHVIGDEHLETEYMFSKDDKILFVKTKDDYNSLPDKVISAYNAMYNTYNFEYIFKTDDDQELTNTNYLNTIYNCLVASQPKIHYGGRIVDVKTPHISQYYILHPELPHNLNIKPGKYCSGRFYFLSRNAISNLIANADVFKNEYLEDYAVGLYLGDQYKEHILNLQTDRVFVDIVNFNI